MVLSREGHDVVTMLRREGRDWFRDHCNNPGERQWHQWRRWWEGIRFRIFSLTFSSVQFSCSVVSDSLWPHGLQHARLPYPSPTPRVYSNSCPLSWWCHPTISSSVIPFSSLIFPSIRVFSNKSVFTSSGQNIGVSASASVLPMNIQVWFPLGWTGWISLLSEALSSVFSNTLQ